MMNVASLSLCKELYELSGWRNGDLVWQNVYADKKYRANDYLKSEVANKFPPAYDLSYLLRKLPKELDGFLLSLSPVDDKWHIEYQWSFKTSLHLQTADTPEDAVCKLAIELFKEGILKK